MMDPLPIDTLVEAFDGVIPGYAWAWHDATLEYLNDGWRYKSKGWRHHARKNIHWRHDRTINLYHIASLDSDWSRRYALRYTGYPPKDIPVPSLLFSNRGYVSLFCASFPDARQAFVDLARMGAGDMRCVSDEGSLQVWLTNDATPFPERYQITMNVLRHIKKTASKIYPIWHTARDLARSS